jgi:hypothetical protein
MLRGLIPSVKLSIALLVALTRVLPKTRGERLGPSSKRNEALKAFHMRLRETLPGPVELWGVRLATPRMNAQEAAILSSFLNARDWDVEDATTMFHSSMRWRRSFGVDRLSASQFEDFPCEIFRGRDNQGNLLVVLRLGELRGDCFKDMQRFVRWRVYMQEALNSQLDFAKGEPLYKLVLNCEGFSTGHFSKAARRCAKELSRVSQDNYPDYLGQILICSPPPIFAFAYGILRPFLPRNFVKLIKVHKGDEASCLAKARQV